MGNRAMGEAPNKPDDGPAIVVAKPSQVFKYLFISWYSPLLRLVRSLFHMRSSHYATPLMRLHAALSATFAYS